MDPQSGAANTHRPADRLHPPLGRFLVGKHLHDLEDRQSLTEVLAGYPVCHFLSGMSDRLGNQDTIKQ